MKWRPDSEAEQCGMWLDMEKDASWLIPLKHTYTLCHAALISQIVIKQRNLMQLKFTIMKLKCHFFTIICICHFRHVDLPPEAARPWENRIQDRRLGISRLEACIRVSGLFYTCHQPVVYLECPRGSEGQKFPSGGQGQSFGRSLGTKSRSWMPKLWCSGRKNSKTAKNTIIKLSTDPSVSDHRPADLEWSLKRRTISRNIGHNLSPLQDTPVQKVFS